MSEWGSSKNRATRSLCHPDRLDWLRKPLAALPVGVRVGVVISEDAIRICLAKNFFGRCRIVETEFFPLEIGSPASWQNGMAAAATRIHGYLEQKQVLKARINVALMGSEIGFRRITLPDMPARELQSALAWEGKSLFPFNLSSSYFHYEVADRIVRDDSRHLGINITAASGDLIKTLYRHFGNEGLKIGQVNFLPYFLSQIPFASGNAPGEHRHIILYLDPLQSVAAFVHNGFLDFCQGFVTRPNGSNRENPVLENSAAMAEELDSFLDIYNAQGGEKAIDGLLLCGRFGGNEETIRAMAEATRLPCRSLLGTGILNGISSCPNPWQLNEGIAAVVTALAPVHKRPLAPPEIQAAEDQAIWVTRLAATAFLLVAGLGLIQWTTWRTEQNLQKRLTLAMTENRRIEDSSVYQTYQRLTAQLQRQRNIDQKTHSGNVGNNDLMLKELSLTIPETVTLAAVSMQNLETGLAITLDGFVRPRRLAAEITLAQYVETLENSPWFQNVTVATHSKKPDHDETLLWFQLKMDARG